MAIKILVLSVVLTVVSTSCPKNCPPGSFISSPTCQCTPCKNGTFTDVVNNLTKCTDCTSICPPSKVISKQCTRKSDALCECRTGQYFDTGLLFCVDCSRCPVGQGSAVQCSTESNTDCKPCVPGKTFSNSSRMGECDKCSPCGAGFYVLKECNITRDNICKQITYYSSTSATSTKTSSTKETSTATQQHSQPATSSWLIPVIVIVACFIVACFIVVWYICCYRRRDRGHHVIDLEDSHEAMNLKLQEPAEEKPNQCPSRHSDSGLRGRHARHPRRMEQSRRKRADCKEHKLVDSDQLIRDVPYPIIDQLALKLNPRGLNNWVRLAGLLQYSQEKVKYFGMDADQSTQRLLADWQTSNTSTVAVLHRHLKRMGRDDAAEILEAQQ